MTAELPRQAHRDLWCRGLLSVLLGALLWGSIVQGPALSAPMPKLIPSDRSVALDVNQSLNPDLSSGMQSAGPVVMSYRSPTCGCCGGWVEHVKAGGFTVQDRVTENLAAIKADYVIPDRLKACHTAEVDGYVVEGHVPVDAIQRLLTLKPDVMGIAVPGMPLGSPGMEAGDLREPFTVYTFMIDGTTEVFQTYP